MNPYDQIIHDAVADVDGLESESEGEEPERRVIIKRPGARVAARRDQLRKGPFHVKQAEIARVAAELGVSLTPVQLPRTRPLRQSPA